MTASPSLAVKFYGTEQAVSPMQTLRAGPLTAELDEGALRFIKINGVEAIRNIAFVVRDKDWGTYNPQIENLNIQQHADSFTVSYDATCQDQQQEMRYNASITGTAEGTLQFSAKGTMVTDFLTNRLGFVVLHPIVGVSGFPVQVERVDGSIEQSEFPELVDPIQPFKDIRALTHEVSPGVKVCCRMEGDTFEMEDHRQWGDASYKTYVRPIALPWPYTMAAGEVTEQSVTLTIEGDVTVSHSNTAEAIQISIGEVSGTMPAIGLGIEPQYVNATLDHIKHIKNLAPKHLVCWFDLRANHGISELQKYKQLATELGTELVLEAVIPGDDYQGEIQQIATQAATAEIQFSAVCISPAAYLMSIMPGTNWPDVAALEDIYDAARAAFPDSIIGGGMHAFFPELNRKRPPVEHLDYITHTSNVITHACDDITVTENLEALPYIIKTCRSFSGGKPYRVGPSAIAMRFNPYGSKTMDNPDNVRIAMARMDPRQRGLVNAAWTVVYVAHMARGGLEAITLQAAVGEFGLIYHKMPWQQFWFDESDAQVYPAFHVVAGLAAASGKSLLNTTSSFSHDVESIAYKNGAQTILWIANLTAEQRQVTVTGLAGSATIFSINSDMFEHAAKNVLAFTEDVQPCDPGSLSLDPYAVVCLTAESS